MDSIKTIDAADGSAQVEFFQGAHGFTTFEEKSWSFEDIPDYGRQEYWSVRYVSGIHETLESAEREARKVIPWLRESFEDSLEQNPC